MTGLPGIPPTACAFVLVLALAPVPAGAQARPVDFSIGSSFLAEIHTGEAGHAVTASFAPTQPVALAGEVMASAGRSLAVWALAGPRFTSGLDRRRTVYVQILAGPLLTPDIFLAVQPGAGINFWVTRAAGIRVGADYHHILSGDEPFHGFRVHAGALLTIGRK